MKVLKISLAIVLFISITAATAHKFYVSTTKIEHNTENESLEIISKIFIDDIEKVLNERYNTVTKLATKKETEKDKALLKEYILEKLKIQVNNEEKPLHYLGIDYDIDIVKVFIEIKEVKELQSLEIENKILMENYEEQQNIIHIKINDKRRSLILDRDNPKGVLNF